MLESVKAKGPRIIVSEKILETLVDETKCPILTDQDGWKHLDYFSRMLLIEEERVGRSEAKSSLAKMISLSDSKEKELSLVGSNGAPKWSAFKKYIEEEVARYF